jgi:hypothetical protein
MTPLWRPVQAGLDISPRIEDNRGQMRGKRCLAVTSVVVLALLAVPSAAPAFEDDLGVTQSLSATRAKPGGTISVESTVTNVGTRAQPETFVELGTLAAYERGANDPYVSFSSSQGSCVDNSAEAFGTVYHDLVCTLGALAPGQTAVVHASMQINQSAVHSTILLPNDHEGGYLDANHSNDAGSQAFYLDVPPTVSGSKKIKLLGLPQGCATGDFTLTAKSKIARTKKMRVNAELGLGEEGSGLTFSKQVKGRKISMSIPASKAEPQLTGSYTVVVKAKLGGGHALKTTIEFTRC